MGSGKLIQKAIKEFGKENFRKEILHVFNDEKTMNEREKELVKLSEETYNLSVGGYGGFDYINQRGLNLNMKNKKLKRTT